MEYLLVMSNLVRSSETFCANIFSPNSGLISLYLINQGKKQKTGYVIGSFNTIFFLQPDMILNRSRAGCAAIESYNYVTIGNLKLRHETKN